VREPIYALAAVTGSTRFDLGFYAGRVFGLLAASFLLIILTVQLAKMYAAALRTIASSEGGFAELSRSRVPRYRDRRTPARSFNARTSRTTTGK
jgi:hypothetical protein